MKLAPLSSKYSFLLIISSGLCLMGVIFFAVISMANQAKKNIAERQMRDNLAPLIAVKRQVRKVTLKKQTRNNQETIEIDSTGLIIRRDKNGKIIKTARQGFAATAALFELINNSLDGKGVSGVPSGYTVIVETNQGNIIIDSEDTNDNGSNDTESNDDGSTIIDTIEDYVDHALNPTPTPKTTSVPLPTATPVISVNPTPTPDQTSLPAYMTAPPFTCEDYYDGGKPIKISNVYCGLDQ